MARKHFIAEIQGKTGITKSRIGDKISGIACSVNGMSIGCKTKCSYDFEADEDIIEIYLTRGHINKDSKDILIFAGSAKDYQKLLREGQ